MSDFPVAQQPRRHGWGLFFAATALLAASLNLLWWLSWTALLCTEDGCPEGRDSWQQYVYPASGLLTLAAVVTSIIVARRSGARSGAAIVTYCLAFALVWPPYALFFYTLDRV